MQALIAISLLVTLPLSSLAEHSPVPSAVELSARLRQLLPEKLKNIIPGKTTKQEVLRSLGMPGSLSKRTDSVMYKLGDHEFDTTIGFKGDQVKYLYHEPAQETSLGSLELENIKSLIPKEALDHAEKEMRTSKPTHETGRMLEVTIPSQGLKLEFRNNSARSLNSVQFMVKSTGSTK